MLVESGAHLIRPMTSWTHFRETDVRDLRSQGLPVLEVGINQSYRVVRAMSRTPHMVEWG